MENNVLITLKGRQNIDGDEDKYEFITVGNYRKKGDKYYVTYEGSEITGYEDTKTTLKIENDYVSMIRFGEPHTQMIFEKGNKYVGYYETPMGALSVGVTTNQMTVEVTDDGGEISLDYFVELNNGGPIRNGLHVSIRKVGTDVDTL